ncbi:MAG: TIGR04149 family rSAM-modified RiPP [Bacteroidetes bacterium]|nr:TIGR04149 family rSAM-modified RiPP [Bacteroidota bacterium]
MKKLKLNQLSKQKVAEREMSAITGGAQSQNDKFLKAEVAADGGCIFSHCDTGPNMASYSNWTKDAS